MYTVTVWSALVGRRERDAANKKAAIALVNEAMALDSTYYIILSKGQREIHWSKEDDEWVKTEA